MMKPSARAVGEIRIITDNFVETLEAMNHWLAWSQNDPIRFDITHEAPGIVSVRFELRTDELGDDFRREFEIGYPG